MQQALVPFRLVAQQQETLGICVQPADGIDVFGKAKLRQRAVGRAVRRELRDDAIGFVEGNEHSRSFKRRVSSFKKIN